jgi:nitric oxide reductase subunit B
MAGNTQRSRPQYPATRQESISKMARMNIGLAWMYFATLFPLGILQLYESVNTGYFEARSLEYITNETNALPEWMRLPGDVVFIVGGVLPLLYLCYLGVTLEELEDILFTDIAEPETAGQRE